MSQKEEAFKLVESLIDKDDLGEVIAEAYGGEMPPYIVDYGHNFLKLKIEGIFGEEVGIITMEDVYNFGNPNFSTMLQIGEFFLDHRPAFHLAEECQAVFNYMIENYLIPTCGEDLEKLNESFKR